MHTSSHAATLPCRELFCPCNKSNNCEIYTLDFGPLLSAAQAKFKILKIQSITIVPRPEYMYQDDGRMFDKIEGESSRRRIL